MMRHQPRVRQRSNLYYSPPAIDRDRVARRLTSCSAIAALAIVGLAFGLALCGLADWWTGASILPLMFAL